MGDKDFEENKKELERKLREEELVQRDAPLTRQSQEDKKEEDKK